jgi:prepilin-type N-terminal cleavage/methylation domain-containing protein
MYRRKAFTLIELLVVIAIIALLVALVVPSLAKAKQTAMRVVCGSKLRALAIAMSMYADTYGDTYPASTSYARLDDDWVKWRSGTNPNDSVIAPFMGQRPVTNAMLTCPNDTDATRRKSSGLFPFSYTVNDTICNGSHRLLNPPEPRVLRRDIKNIAQKIIIAEEAAETIDDGAWAPWAGWNNLSIRHDKNAEALNDMTAGRGMVAFTDAHAEFITRKLAHDLKYYDPDEIPNR